MEEDTDSDATTCNSNWYLYVKNVTLLLHMHPMTVDMHSIESKCIIIHVHVV